MKIDLSRFSLPIYQFLQFSDKLIEALGKVECALKAAKPVSPTDENKMGEAFSTIENKIFYADGKTRFNWKIICIKGNLYAGLQSFKFDDDIKRFRIDLKGFFLPPRDWTDFSETLIGRLRSLKKKYDETRYLSPSASLRYEQSKPNYSPSSPIKIPLQIREATTPSLKRKREGMFLKHPRDKDSFSPYINIKNIKLTNRLIFLNLE